MKAGGVYAAVAAVGAIVGDSLQGVYDSHNTTSRALAPVIGAGVAVGAYAVGSTVAVTGLTAGAIVVVPALVITAAFLSFLNQAERQAREGELAADEKSVMDLVAQGRYEDAWARNVELWETKPKLYKDAGRIPAAWRGGMPDKLPLSNGQTMDVASALELAYRESQSTGDALAAQIEAVRPYVIPGAAHRYRWPDGTVHFHPPPKTDAQRVDTLQAMLAGAAAPPPPAVNAPAPAPVVPVLDAAAKASIQAEIDYLQGGRYTADKALALYKLGRPVLAPATVTKPPGVSVLYVRRPPEF